ncbi:MAG: hypothetical protein ABEJ31_08190 [Haloarculaceae archaeon]
MEECEYCGASIADEQAYYEHLAEAHDDELSRLDRRRVAHYVGEDGDGLPTGPLLLGGALIVAIAVLAYVVFFAGGATGGAGGPAADPDSSAPAVADDAPLGATAMAPTDLGAVNEHGTVAVVVDGRRIDFGTERYQYRARTFDFENGNGTVWHVNARNVTLAYAMSTVGIYLNRTAVSVDGTTYSGTDPGTNVTIRVNGDAVDPATYVLQGVPAAAKAAAGDRVRIAVSTDANG